MLKSDRHLGGFSCYGSVNNEMTSGRLRLPSFLGIRNFKRCATAQSIAKETRYGRARVDLSLC